MKPTFIALLALCLCVAGCGKKEEKQLPVMSPASREVQALDLAEAKAAKGAARAKARMEAWIRGAAKKPTGELTKADYEKVEAVDLTGYQLTKVPKDLEKLTQLKGLYLSFNKLTDVKGLDKLTQLERLNLGHNQLTSVKELEKLTQLTRLELEYNKLTDVKGLEKLTKLTRLELFFNQLTDVTGLEKLNQLEDLSFSDNQLTELPKGLEQLTQLKGLYLCDNQLTDVTGLEKLTQLKTLDLRDNPDLNKAQIAELQKALPKCTIFSNPYLTKEESAKVIEAAIRKAAKKPTGELTKADLEKVTRLDFKIKVLTDVTGLEKLTQLTNLNLSFNKLTHVKGLEKLTQLTNLNLSYNILTDVKGLEKLTQLETLNLSWNPDLTKAQIAEVQKTLPKCRIFNNTTK